MVWKKALLWILSVWVYGTLAAQILTPVQSKVEWKELSAEEAELQFHLTIEEHWHVYSTHMPDGGPISASLKWTESEGVAPVGELKGRGEERTKFDDLFGMDVRYYANEVTFVQRVRYTAGEYAAAGHLTYGACDDQTCIPPTKIPFSFSGKVTASGDSTAVNATQAGEAAARVAREKAQDSLAAVAAARAEEEASASVAETVPDDWTPVTHELRGMQEGSNASSNSLIYILLAGFVGGLLALLTPCVWPIIPLTVSFFLKRSSDRRRGIRDAVLYGAAIVIIYLSLGLVVTFLFGATALNELSTNAVFNLVCFLLLIVFGISFLGYFDIELPSSWGNKLNSKAESAGGFLAIFLMAFTLVVVSFSCTGPIIGFLLVDVSGRGELLAPALGMGGFALALALPFTLFALFPSWMKRMPKSGGWMNRLKVTLAFIEFGFALKFFSVADLAYGWGLLSRNTFLVIWIVLTFGLLLYWVGIIRFPHDKKGKKPGRASQLIGVVVLIPSLVYLFGGLNGNPLHAISGFLPPVEYRDSGSGAENHFRDYDAGMAYARKKGLPVMLDFTGYGCVNCRKMESSVWLDPGVKKLMAEYVLISLYVDDRQSLPEPMKVRENGVDLLLETEGERWSYLQRMKFGANAQPFYVLLDLNGRPLGPSFGFTEKVSAFEDFLSQGLQQFHTRKR